MTRPVISAPIASGTIAHQPVRSIAVHAARTVCTSGLVTAAIPSARYATTAPIHPTEHVRWMESANLRTAGVMLTVPAYRAQWRWSPACVWEHCRLDEVQQ